MRTGVMGGSRFRTNFRPIHDPELLFFQVPKFVPFSHGNLFDPRMHEGCARQGLVSAGQDLVGGHSCCVEGSRVLPPPQLP